MKLRENTSGGGDVQPVVPPASYCPHVEHSELSARVRFLIAREFPGVETFEVLASYTEEDLLRKNNAGPALVREVRRALEFRGLKLRKYERQSGLAACGLPLPSESK